MGFATKHTVTIRMSHRRYMMLKQAAKAIGMSPAEFAAAATNEFVIGELEAQAAETDLASELRAWVLLGAPAMGNA